MEASNGKLMKPDEQLFGWDVLPTAPPKVRPSPALLLPETEESILAAQLRIPTSSTQLALPRHVTLKWALDKKRSKFPAHDFQTIHPVNPLHVHWTGPSGFRSFGIAENMADEIPLIPKVSELEVRTGNIVNWNRLKRKPSQNPTDEISECVKATLEKCLEDANKTELQYVKVLECVDPAHQQQSMQDERGELKVIVKLFICSEQSPDIIVEAINKVTKELNISFVETVLLSLSMFESEEEIKVDQLKPYWTALEGLVGQDMVHSIGVADLDKAKLTQLYNWAKVKPCINQVNLASCCVMPKDLTEYAKEVDIQLQTHNDPPELLPSGKLKETLRQCVTEQDSVGWGALWVARYSVLIKCRGIIKSKGYILRALRDPYQPFQGVKTIKPPCSAGEEQAPLPATSGGRGRGGIQF